MSKKIKGLFLLVIFLIFMPPVSIYAEDFKMDIPYGQKYLEGEFYPDRSDILEAQEYLSSNRIVIPEEIAELCEFYGKKNNIAPELLEAIIFKESAFNPRVFDSTLSCKGLMQIKTSAHQSRMDRLGVTNIFDPAGNISVGSDYLRELFEENDIETALMLYNGDSNARKDDYISEYVKKILLISDYLQRVHYFE